MRDTNLLAITPTTVNDTSHSDDASQQARIFNLSSSLNNFSSVFSEILNFNDTYPTSTNLCKTKGVSARYLQIVGHCNNRHKTIPLYDANIFGIYHRTKNETPRLPTKSYTGIPQLYLHPSMRLNRDSSKLETV
ncbi:hypothetical protein ILUMI_16368 [Ignelater luminosus]|uniref:Uncharacterized protein n=1 Tax=Ignelater luminosus TaxID=2038154 RepID=A0A8K0CM08_IGNLU|nr:hypothetical protein ILUMI_16368 [Ignelater luminosus]